MKRNFHWDTWNREHIAEHSVSQAEAESVVINANPPFPRKIGEQKFLVWGKTSAGRFLQVILSYTLTDESIMKT